ncbi:hypothetical protein HMPREF9447_04987 [Bacteroides oleiciplenus YIT 12058]|uniref:Uncharacterized protein n=1 Tax=Bacteroides oleiciplenus YIT 12058 TaxID=742727 RepID=K9DY83_9BACE|nr:hypothetical protein HMPREF9447_04987 [Bacteroides oleiciplenus YIT 12058]
MSRFVIKNLTEKIAEDLMNEFYGYNQVKVIFGRWKIFTCRNGYLIKEKYQLIKEEF